MEFGIAEYLLGLLEAASQCGVKLADRVEQRATEEGCAEDGLAGGVVRVTARVPHDPAARRAAASPLSMAACTDLVDAGFGEEGVEPIDQFAAGEERSCHPWRRGVRGGAGATCGPCAPRAEPSLLNHFQVETTGCRQRHDRILLVTPRRWPLAFLAGTAGGRGRQVALLLRSARVPLRTCWRRGAGDLLFKDESGADGAHWR